MSDILTITGIVATVPRHLVTSEGLPITSFRLASTQRRFDRGQQRWIDGETNWYTVTAFRQLAVNSTASLEKGQRVLVTGRLRIRDWASNERTGTTVEVDADSIGHDLAWGTSKYTRSVAASTASEQIPDAPAEAPEPDEPATGQLVAEGQWATAAPAADGEAETDAEPAAEREAQPVPF